MRGEPAGACPRRFAFCGWASIIAPMRIVLLALLFALPLAAQPDMQLLRGTTELANGGEDNLNNTGFAPFNITYTIRNDGTTDLDLTGLPLLAITDEDNCTVTILQDPATPVAAAASTTFRLQVSPISATAFSFNVSIASNDTLQNPYTFTLEGNTSKSSGSGGGGGSASNDCSTSARDGMPWLIVLLALCWLARRATGARSGFSTPRDARHFVD